MGEFELIRRFFDRVPGTAPGPGVTLGIGDDCALLQVPAGHELAVSSDMLVEGRHFFPDVDPAALGWKALAVNLSDLAAMGAEPLGFTLALALPRVDEAWLERFAQGLFECASAHGCPLVGGDTTRGPLNLCITVFGTVPLGKAVRRSGARDGDEVWVSGAPGRAALGLRILQAAAASAAGAELDVLTNAGPRANDVTSAEPGTAVEAGTRAGGAALAPLVPAARAECIAALERPVPRLALGRALRGVASAMIDVSDGLLGDLRHVLEASGLGHATLFAADMPVAPALAAQPEAIRHACLLAGGDDYELCFTASVARRAAVLAAARQTGVPVARIGVVGGAGARSAAIVVQDPSGQPLAGLEQLGGYDHFAAH